MFVAAVTRIYTAGGDDDGAEEEEDFTLVVCIRLVSSEKVALTANRLRRHTSRRVVVEVKQAGRPDKVCSNLLSYRRSVLLVR